MNITAGHVNEYRQQYSGLIYKPIIRQCHLFCSISWIFIHHLWRRVFGHSFSFQDEKYAKEILLHSDASILQCDDCLFSCFFNLILNSSLPIGKYLFKVSKITLQKNVILLSLNRYLPTGNLSYSVLYQSKFTNISYTSIELLHDILLFLFFLHLTDTKYWFFLCDISSLYNNDIFLAEHYHVTMPYTLLLIYSNLDNQNSPPLWLHSLVHIF